MMKQEVGKKTDFGGDAFKTRPLRQERVEKVVLLSLEKLHQRVPPAVLVASNCVSLT